MFGLTHVNLSRVLCTAALLLFSLYLVDLNMRFCKINLLLLVMKKNLCFSFLLSTKYTEAQSRGKKKINHEGEILRRRNILHPEIKFVAREKLK